MAHPHPHHPEPPLKKLRVLNFGDNTGAVAELRTAWDVLRESDLSGCYADTLEDVTGPVVNTADTGALPDDAFDERGEKEAEARAGAAQAAGAAYEMLQGITPAHAAGRGGGYALKPVRPDPLSTKPAKLDRREAALGKAADVLRRGGRAMAAAAAHAKDLHEAVLAQQAAGRLLTRPVEADGSSTPLPAVAARAEGEAATLIRQTSALLWAALGRLLPVLELPVFYLTSTALEVGLLPWMPRYWTLSGRAELAKEGARQGHDVAFAVAQLPKGWVDGHLIGCVAEAIARNKPHAPFRSTDVHLADGLYHLQHLALLSFIADLAKSVTFVTTVTPVGYPVAGKVTLAHPRTGCIQALLFVNGLAVTVTDADDAYEDICVGAAEVNDALMRMLETRYITNAENCFWPPHEDATTGATPHSSGAL
eukprot:TRINITY_DN20409_c0_g1_i1.p1 TRINITY_DN20409_c0_g1~~TRINITY_DN20409_c0_g1_i1.p1  ORF type:complete len:423 (+),score=129.83 TRINITY_DN20409_c0_g1_i1:109-1377(+)